VLWGIGKDRALKTPTRGNIEERCVSATDANADV
jgi:hypothetical protein